jgi:hypothetical protein
MVVKKVHRKVQFKIAPGFAQCIKSPAKAKAKAQCLYPYLACPIACREGLLLALSGTRLISRLQDLVIL